MTYKPIPTTKRAGKKSVRVFDSFTEELLAKILEQLKIMNLHMKEITDEEIDYDSY